jgi:hypothetical protein
MALLTTCSIGAASYQRIQTFSHPHSSISILNLLANLVTSLAVMPGLPGT